MITRRATHQFNKHRWGQALVMAKGEGARLKKLEGSPLFSNGHTFFCFDKPTITCTIVHMKIVADTNTFLATALNEPEKKAIIALTLGHEIIAPEILPFEIGNALSAMVKRGRLNRKEGLAAYDETQKIPVELRSIDIRKALNIAGQHKIYAYDAYFLECARATHSPLFTLDAAMKKIAVKLGITLLEVKP